MKIKVRKSWGQMNPVTKVVPPKKGKGAYNRSKFKSFSDE